MQKQLQSKLDGLRTQTQMPALWAGKFHVDGRYVQAASGVRKWKNATPVEVTDAIHIGSCTKAMTAVLIAQLCSAGSLSLETTLTEIFPSVAGLADSAWGNVTVNELLQHRSGARADADWQQLHNENSGDVVAGRRAMLCWLIDCRRPESPTFVYSNVGYALLGHIIETLEHKPWEEVIRTRLFEPLDIQSAGFGPVTEHKIAEQSGETPNAAAPSKLAANATDEPRCAWGHTVDISLVGVFTSFMGISKAINFKPVQVDNPPPLGPAGRVHLTMREWSRFVLLFADKNGYEKIGVKADIWERMLTPTAGGEYAGGWVFLQREWAGGKVLFHNGSNTTWYCVAFVPPGSNYCLLAASNTFPASQEACDKAVVIVKDLKL